MAHPDEQTTSSDALELRSLVLIAIRRRWIIAVACLAYVVANVGWVLTQPRTYRADAALVSREDAALPASLQALSGSGLLAGMGGSSLQTHEELISDPRLVRQALARLGVEMSEKDFATFMSRDFSINLPVGASVLKVQVKDENPGRAADYANAIADEYLEQLRNKSRSSASEAAAYVQEQLDTIGAQILETEEVREDYKLQAGIADVQAQVEAAVSRLADLESEAVRARAGKAAAEQSRGRYREQLEAIDETYVASSVIARNPLVTDLEQKLADLVVEYQGAKATYGPEHAEVKRIEGSMNQTRDELAAAVENLVSQTVEAPNPVHQQLYEDLARAEATTLAEGAREQALQSVAGQLRSELSALPIHEKALGAMERETRLLTEVYIALFKHYHETKLMEIMARVDLRIQYPAEPPTRPTPRGLGVKLIVSTVMGLLLGALLAGLAEALDRRVRCDTDATEALGLPVLGRIPWLRKARRAEAVLTDPAYQEAVRRLRAALMLNLGGAGGKAVLIAGATNCEGRSVLAAALGESIAAAGRRVVLVDAAAESPTLHSYLGVEAQAGWWDAAAGRGNAASLVQATGKPNLDLLPAGSEPVDPDALASSEVARGIIDSLRATHDLVIVDTSPMEQDSVAALLSGSCDHGLVVVREGHSCRGMVHNLWHHLNHSDGWALGLALVAPRGRTPRR